jgi:hypothetical protein
LRNKSLKLVSLHLVPDCNLKLTCPQLLCDPGARTMQRVMQDQGCPLLTTVARAPPAKEGRVSLIPIAKLLWWPPGLRHAQVVFPAVVDEPDGAEDDHDT